LPFWSLNPPDEAVPEADAAEVEPEPELSRIMGNELVGLALSDKLDFDGLFSLMTAGDAVEAAVGDEDGASEQSADGSPYE
jgi:hypothetical protein